MSERMRILFISTMRGASWGGSEELWCAAARRAVDAGHAVGVSVYAWRPRAGRVEDLERAGALVVERPLEVSRWAGWFGTPGWVRAMDEFRADVVCLSQGSAYECVGRRAARPVFTWLEARRPALVNIVQAVRDEEVVKARTAEAARRLHRLAAVNAFVARANAEAAEKQVGERPRGVRVVRNPVNMRDVSALEWPRGGGPARFACVARLEAKIKGQDTLLRVLGGPEWKGRDWELTLAGLGPDVDALREMARGLGIAERVKFPGQVKDLRGLWSDHHALVLASRVEGTPLAMVEAMLLGRPCVVTRVGGCGEWVTQGVNGFVAEDAGEGAVARAMERLWGARGAWEAMGARARAVAAEMYDPDPGGTVLRMLEEAGAGRRAGGK